MATAPEWADLPDFALLAILLRLHSLPDLFAIAGVCRTWRSFLRSADAAHLYLSSRPPLLLRPLPRPRPCRRLWWPIRATPPQPSTVASFCRVHALDETSSFQSLLSNEPPTTLYLGYSHGHLLLLRRDHRQPLLADVLSGAEFLLPRLRLNRSAFYYAALSAPPSYPGCCLLLFLSKRTLLYCPLGGHPDPRWTKHFMEPGVATISQVLNFKGRIFAINHSANLLAFHFDPNFEAEVLEVGGLQPMPAYDRCHFGPQLVECDGKLLLVLFGVEDDCGQRWIARVHVYRMDFGRMVWVEVESLGDFSLFIDCWGKCPVPCVGPSSWGGRSNCVYVAGPGCDAWRRYSLDYKTWGEYSLDGKMMDTNLSLPSSLSNLSLPRWPSPIWVYPSLFFGS